MAQEYFVYILTNRHHSVLYTGVTNNLPRRVSEHRAKLVPGFTARYNVDKLVFYEGTSDVRAAISREKPVKAGSRRDKVVLITGMNPDWNDLFGTL